VYRFGEFEARKDLCVPVAQKKGRRTVSAGGIM
jgi:hypothetical protein